MAKDKGKKKLGMTTLIVLPMEDLAVRSVMLLTVWNTMF